MGLSIQRTNRDSYQLVAVSGCMGNDEFYHLEKELEQLLDDKQYRVILDCSALSFATGVSLARLFVVARSFRHRGRELKGVGVSPAIARIVQLVGFEREIEIYSDLASALSSVSSVNPPMHKPRSRAKR